MRIAIMGSGGVGGYFGARLAESGQDVAFVARGAHLAAMQAEGLRVVSQRGDVHLHPVRTTSDPATIGPVDHVFFTVKLWDTDEAARQVRPLLGPHTAVISFQNGVEANDVLAGVLGREHLMGGAAYISAIIDRPGVIKHTGQMARLAFGEFEGARPSRAEALLEACRAAGIDADVPASIEQAIWQKFVFLVALSGATALTRKPIGPVRSDPDTRALFVDLMREAAAVARSRGIDVGATYVDERLAFAGTLAPETTSSMHHDLERGNRLELPWLQGAVVRLGQELGVPTPATRFVYTALKLQAAGRAAA